MLCRFFQVHRNFHSEKSWTPWGLWGLLFPTLLAPSLIACLKYYHGDAEADQLHVGQRKAKKSDSRIERF